MRGRGAGDDIVGRAAEESLREGSGENAVRARQTGEGADDTRRVRSEIERTRSDMSETIDEIQNRLSPSNMAAQARETIKEKTVGRVRNLAGSAGEGASDLADRTRQVARDTVGENPWPAILLGVGAAWMIFDRTRRSGHDYETERLLHDDGSAGYYEVDRGGASGAAGRPWRGSSDYDESVSRDYRSGDTWRTGEQGGLSRSSRQAIGRARSNMSDFSSRMQHLMQRNPLVVGAVAAAVGVAVGLSLPETERENRLMGEARDGLLEKAQDAAQSAVDTVKEKVENATKLL
jgi:ElaB/YqjD/DUF883 family membrane-anchored ribosome-binding protein